MELKTTKEKVLVAAAKCSTVEATLKTLFPEVFKREYTDIKTFKDACEVECIDPKAFYEKYKNLDDDSLAYEELKIIIHAINNNKSFPNWKDGNSKWVPYFDMSGFGLSGTYYDDWHTYTAVGSRLCFESKEKMLHAVKYFLPFYERFMSKK